MVGEEQIPGESWFQVTGAEWRKEREPKFKQTGVSAGLLEERTKNEISATNGPNTARLSWFRDMK